MGDDETVALTAFVVIALQHGLAVFQDDIAEQLKQKVVRVFALSWSPALPLSPQEPKCPAFLTFLPTFS